MTRKKITDEIVGEVMHKSDCKCCIHNDKRGVHIHHLNGDSSNSEFDNLVYLCFECHDEASKTGGLSRKLPESAIRKYRDDWYELVELKRKATRNVFNIPLNSITTEDLLIASKNALIIIELVKIRQEYYAAEWEKKGDILESIDKYYPHTNFRLAYDLFSFLREITDYNRGKMTESVASSIMGLVMNFLPYSDDEADSEKMTEILQDCCRIGFNIAFDTSIYMGNFKTIMFGLTILKYVHKKAKEQEIQPILNRVNGYYIALEVELDGPQYKNYAELIGYFRTDLTTNNLAFPFLSDNLMMLIYPERN